MQYKELTTVAAVLLAAVLPVSVLATHKVGDPCTQDKYQNSFGCSSDGCSIVQCIPEPNGGDAWYWAQNKTCAGVGMCNNGVCNEGTSATWDDKCS